MLLYEFTPLARQAATEPFDLMLDVQRLLFPCGSVIRSDWAVPGPSQSPLPWRNG